MHPAVQGEFANYPESIRELFPRVQHSVFELRQSMEIYKYLFMDKRERTTAMGEVLGAVLGTTQHLLDEWIILAIARMLDDGQGDRSVLSLRRLVKEALKEFTAKEGREYLESSWKKVEELAVNIPLYRNKVIGHYDLGVGLGEKSVTEPVWSELEETASAMELVLRWITALATADITINPGDPRIGTARDPRLSGTRYVVRGRDRCWAAEMATYKALAYDDLVKREVIHWDERKKFEEV